jgi:uncharacterized protein (DUF1330 family)
MIYLTQLIYIKEGEESTFLQFEEVAIPIISRYHGKLMLRVRPTDHSIVEATIEKPYEIHLLEFHSENDFHDFMNDPDRKKFLHLKEKSIRSSILVKGEMIGK